MMSKVYRNGMTLQRVACAILFVIFSFCFLYFFQADILAAAQHVLSHGKTTYNAAVGAVLITLVLYVLQIGVAMVTRLRGGLYALTYFPSLLLLTVLTDISTHIDTHFSFGWWALAVPVLLLLYAGVVYIVWQNHIDESHRMVYSKYLRLLWVNMGTLCVMFWLTAVYSQTNDVFHYRMRAEQYLLKGDYAAAAQVGIKSGVADSSLTMLRAYALARQGVLADRLFTYPVTGGSRALLPDSSTVRLVVFPVDNIYRDLGVRLKQQASPLSYLKFIVRHGYATAMGRDYLLTAYLLDRNLDAFARTLGRYYTVNDSLPRHYREALTLYTHQHSAPCIEYHNSVMDTDYEDYQQLYQSESNRIVRQAKLRDSYGNTYWYYYQQGE